MLWFNRPPVDLLPAVLEKLPENVDLGLDRVHYSQNEEGRKKWVLDADRAAYQRKESELSLSGVELVFFNAGEFGDLKLSAKSGVLFQQEQLIDLEGDVRIHAENGASFATDRLHYDFKRRRARTDAPVRIRSEKLDIRGEGMTLDLERGQMKLLSKVHALLDDRGFAGEDQ